MFNYSDKTNIDKSFKMNELFKLVKANKTLKAGCEMITAVKLSHVLAPHNTNLEPCNYVNEIYIIEITVNKKQTPDDFIEAFNKQILFQTLFKICYNTEVKYVCSLKHFDETQNMKILKTYSSEWQSDTPQEMPITNKLETVYKKIIANIVGYNFRENEDLHDYMERISAIKRQKLEIERLTRMMNAEKQPNIKMNINDRIKQMTRKLQNLEV